MTKPHSQRSTLVHKQNCTKVIDIKFIHMVMDQGYRCRYVQDLMKIETVLFVVSSDLLSCMDEVRMVTGGLRPPCFLLLRASVCVGRRA